MTLYYPINGSQYDQWSASRQMDYYRWCGYDVHVALI